VARGRRLDAYLAHAGIGSRSDVKKLVRRGRVTVDGEAVKDFSLHLTEGQVVRVDDEVIDPPLEGATLLLHKPEGHATSHDLREAPLVFDLVPDRYRTLSIEAVGRLDRETTGLLVLTTDGQLNHALTHPKRKVSRRYRIRYVGDLAPDAVEQVARGIQLHDEETPTRPATLTLGPEPGEATLILREGRFHQVRRMIAALGGRVVSLHRDRIGGLELPEDLGPGAIRDATEDELAALVTPGDDDA